MANKALEYAEDTLGVHDVYERANQAQDNLDATLTKIAEAKDKRRDLEARVTDREMIVTSDEWEKHPDMAVTRMDKHIKVALNNDTELRELREQLWRAISDIEGLEFDKTVAQNDINIATSRMTQLGGYLNYLAAVKQTAAKPEKPATPTTPGATS